jgi:nucleoside-specific outer membrane channel protein Tsx
MKNNILYNFVATQLFALITLFSIPAFSETWSKTEVQLQAFGELERVGTGGTAEATILTFQHAGGWEYGDNFFFVDHSRHSVNNDANFAVADSSEFYGEWYSSFSLGAISGNDLSLGIVKDFSLVIGSNFAPEVDSMWVLPGVKLSLDLTGFAFASVTVTGFMHQGGGDSNSQVFTIVDEDSSFMVDFAWAYPFKIGSMNWTIEGHLEYINGRTQTSNFRTAELESWVLFQPQVRLDLGEVLGYKAGKLFAGIEYQYWKNKLGEKGTDDNALQMLIVWRF